MATSNLDRAYPRVKTPVRKSAVSICVLDRNTWKSSSDQLAVLKAQLSINEDKYPGIDRWFTKKVAPGIQSGQRKAYVVFESERPVATAVLKLGRSAKLCHMRIDEDYQDASLGQVLLFHMTFDMLEWTKEVHFTLPETLWASKQGFFKSFGFSQANRTSLHYRKDEAELSCSAPFSKVYSAVKKKIPGLLRRLCLKELSGQSDLLMSIRANFAERLMNGSKSIEIRKHFSDKWAGRDVVFYASKPVKSLVGQATVNSVTKGRPGALWSQFETQIGCSRSEFDAYVGDTDEITAIEFKNVFRYEESVMLSKLSDLLRQKLTPPQSYLGLSSNKKNQWLNAIYLASLFRRSKNNSHQKFPV